jgi:hypothetical protein
LATPKAVKIAGITPWIHHSQIKKAAAPVDPNDWQAIHDATNLLKLRFQRIHNSTPLPKRASALLQPPPRSWMVNAWWKPEDLPARM